jgi:hypothetical protein
VVVRFKGPESHSWLRPGGEYVVLAVSVSLKGPMPLTFMIHHPEDRGAWDWGWWEVSLFEIVDGDLPNNWSLGFDRFGGFDLMPAAWRRHGHWDDLDPSETDTRPPDVRRAATRRAWSDYRAERDRILAQAGRPAGYQGEPGPSCPAPRRALEGTES